MSRSRRAVAETRWRGASAHGAGERRRLEDESLLERQLLPGAVSATKCAVILLSALCGPSTVLYPGAGYAGPGSDPVRVLQRRLHRDGYRPGPIDGRYGPLTERAVSRFQAALGLSVAGKRGEQ